MSYNRFHDPDEYSDDVVTIRRLHAEMDRAVLDAYGWTDIPIECDFILDTSRTKRSVPPARSHGGTVGPMKCANEALACLLALNTDRAQEERLELGDRGGKTPLEAPSSRLGQPVIWGGVRVVQAASSIHVRSASCQGSPARPGWSGPGEVLESELLRQTPSAARYLTGFLVPLGASDAQRVDETVTEEVDAAGESGGVDDGCHRDAGSEKSVPAILDRTERDAPARRGPLYLTVRWGDYHPEAPSRRRDEPSEELSAGRR